MLAGLVVGIHVHLFQHHRLQQGEKIHAGCKTNCKIFGEESQAINLLCRLFQTVCTHRIMKEMPNTTCHCKRSCEISTLGKWKRTGNILSIWRKLIETVWDKREAQCLEHNTNGHLSRGHAAHITICSPNVAVLFLLCAGKMLQSSDCEDCERCERCKIWKKIHTEKGRPQKTVRNCNHVLLHRLVPNTFLVESVRLCLTTSTSGTISVFLFVWEVFDKHRDYQGSQRGTFPATARKWEKHLFGILPSN